MSKFGIALMTAAAISLLERLPGGEGEASDAGGTDPPDAERAAAPDTHTLPPGKATQDQLMRYAFTLREAVMVQLPNSARYQGKICSVRLSLNRSAKLTGLQQRGGRSGVLRGSDRCGTAHDLPALCQRRGLPDL